VWRQHSRNRVDIIVPRDRIGALVITVSVRISVRISSERRAGFSSVVVDVEVVVGIVVKVRAIAASPGLVLDYVGVDRRVVVSALGVRRGGEVRVLGGQEREGGCCGRERGVDVGARREVVAEGRERVVEVGREEQGGGWEAGEGGGGRGRVGCGRRGCQEDGEDLLGGGITRDVHGQGGDGLLGVQQVHEEGQGRGRIGGGTAGGGRAHGVEGG
jgi:hypothetical protein